MSQENKGEVKPNKTESKQEFIPGEPRSDRRPDGKFKKGVKANPKGRPKGVKNFTTKIKEALIKLSEHEGKSYEDLLVDRVLVESIQNGNTKIINHLWDHLDGRPMQKIEHSGKISISQLLDGAKNK